MGAERGGIEANLAAIRQAVLDWLTYVKEQVGAPTLSGDDEYEAGDEENHIARLVSEDPDMPKLPEIYELVLESRRFGLPIIKVDSYFDLPELYRREINAVIDAEAEFNTIELINKRLKALYEQTTQE